MQQEGAHYSRRLSCDMLRRRLRGGWGKLLYQSGDVCLWFVCVNMGTGHCVPLCHTVLGKLFHTAQRLIPAQQPRSQGRHEYDDALARYT